MDKVWMRIVVGLSIAGGGLATAGSANATVWRNFANESYCLSAGNNGSMNLGTGLVIWQCNTDVGKPVGDQAWGQVTAPFNANYQELYDMKAPAPPPFGNNTPARCTGPSGGNYSDGIQLILWSCNSATQGHDQGWHAFIQPNDANGHRCYSFTNEAAAENPTYQPPLIEVFGVSNAVMTNGTQVIMWQYFTDWTTGKSTHPDQVWCAY
jgi:hypothetical protein